MSFDSGTRLSDRYRLLTCIGTGGMGSVWRAVDEVLDREVAVKVMAPQLSDDAEFVQRFRREARAAARLDHPHIAQVYDYGEVVHDGRTVQYLVMELLVGQTLAHRLQDGPLPWREAAAIGADVAAALAAAHRRGVIHRDIAPGNIMMTPTGAKVLDFGISTVAGETAMTLAGRTLGTPAYLAPERLVARGADAPGTTGHEGAPPGPAVDVYSLAAVLVHVVTGRTPYEGSWSEQAHAHVHDPPPAVTGVPDEFARVLHACLSKDAAARPSSDELAGALRQQAGDGPAATLVLPTGTIPTPHRAPDATRVMPAYADERDAGLARPGGASRMAASVALAAAVVAAVLVAANLLTRPSSSPAGSASEAETSQQATTEPPADLSADLSVDEALSQIHDVARDALSSGEMSRRTNLELRRSLARALNQTLSGDFRDAEQTLDDAAKRLEKRLESGDVTDEVYADINDLLQILADRVDEAAGSG